MATDLSTYFQNGVSAIEASVFNQWGGEVQDLRDQSIAARDEAVAAAEQAVTPTDAQVASLVQTPSSATRARLDSQYASRTDLSGGLAQKLDKPLTVPFTPALTAATTNPTLGTGAAVEGQYTRIGDWIQGWGIIVFGTGATAGSGAYFISIPVPCAVTTAFPTVADVYYFGGTWMTGLGFPQTATTLALRVTGASPSVSNSSPWTWAAGNQIRYRFSYSAAS